MYQYRKATPSDLESVWDRSIADHHGDPRWIAWKEEYIRYNQNGRGATFVVLHNGRPVGEGTLLFSPQCSAIRGGRSSLTDTAPPTSTPCASAKSTRAGAISPHWSA